LVFAKICFGIDGLRRLSAVFKRKGKASNRIVSIFFRAGHTGIGDGHFI